MNITVNFLAVIVAAVASMSLGFFWYNPTAFGKRWMKLMGFSAEDPKEEQKKMGPLYALSFVGAIVIAYVLTHEVRM